MQTVPHNLRFNLVLQHYRQVVPHRQISEGKAAVTVLHPCAWRFHKCK